MRKGTLHTIFVLMLAVLLSAMVPVIGAVFATNNFDEQILQKEEERIQTELELEHSEQRQYLYQQEGLSIDEKLTALDDDLVGLEGEIVANEASLVKFGKDVDEKAKEVDEMEVKLRGVSKSLYKLSKISLIDILFSADGISDLVQQVGFRRFGIGHLLEEVRGFQLNLLDASSQYNSLSDTVSSLEGDLETLRGEVVALENQKIAYAQMAAAEAARQGALSSQIANITAEQAQLIQEKMAATQQSTSIGEYEDVVVELPEPPFSPAYAVASIGYPHRIGMSQYGAYGRSKEGQNYQQIVLAYFNASVDTNYSVPDEILVEGYGWMPFEDQYLKGIAEMPTSWGGSGGMEALKAQAVLARSYALAFTNNGGPIPICTTQSCQVYYHPKVTDPAAALWHQAVAETRGHVLVSDGAPVKAFYASTAGGYTRLPADFDVWGGAGTNLLYLKRVIDFSGDGKAYDGPGHGNSPWYYRVWYAQSDVHPWLTSEEMVDLLNSALLPDQYNSHLSHPDLGGWSHAQVRSTLSELGITPINDISSITVINSNEGYTATLGVLTSSGLREVGGWRLNNVYKLRSRGHLALWSSLYDVIVR